MVSTVLSKSKLTLEYPYLKEDLQVIANEHNAFIMAGYTREENAIQYSSEVYARSQCMRCQKICKHAIDIMHSCMQALHCRINFSVYQFTRAVVFTLHIYNDYILIW